MSNIIKINFNLIIENSLEPYPDYCEYFKVDFIKKQIKAYRHISNINNAYVNREYYGQSY